MSSADGSPDRRAERVWGAVAIVLLLVALGCFGAVLRSSSRQAGAPLTPPTAGPAVPGPAGAAAPEGMRPGLARSAPVGLRVPAIGLDVPVSLLGLNPDRTVQVPADAQLPGWFRLGPSPGELGSAVILGHVDSRLGPAVFFRLRSLRAGDRVDVSRADGTVARFVVDGVAMYPKERFPARQVYGSHGYSALQLVTCGGDFDPGARSYRSNVVVYTSLADAETAAA